MSLKLFIPAALLIFLAACDKDNNSGSEPEPPVPSSPSVVSTSVADGAEIDADAVSEIRISYSTSIELNRTQKITLNGKGLAPSVADGNTLVLPVSLEPASEYTLLVPEKAIIADKGAAYAPAFTLSFSTLEQVAPEHPSFAPLTNPSASPQARNVYQFLIEQNGRKIISGAMAKVNNNNDFADWVYEVSGKYPALTGYDFIHLQSSAPGAWIDYSDISPARTQWDNNGLVSYMWHWNVPDSEEDYRKGQKGKYGFYAPGKGSETTEFDIREALKEGTWQHEFIIADIDRVAETLKLLQAAGIPVLWRPLHEAAGDYRYGPWFWWGRHGDEYTRQLWILMHDRLVGHHGLNNLIWVWTAQYQAGYEAQMKASYPGDDYVDIVGVDLYPSNDASQVDAYRAALDMTGGRKLVSLSEIGRIPDPSKCMTDGAAWSWFMLWYTYSISSSSQSDDFGNTRASIRAVMDSPFVIDRASMPSLK